MRMQRAHLWAVYSYFSLLCLELSTSSGLAIKSNAQNVETYFNKEDIVMRKFIVPLLIVALVIAIAMAWAQRPASQKSEEQEKEKAEGTEIERFLSMRGLLMEKKFYGIGSIEPEFGKPVEFTAIKIKTPGDEKNARFGVKFEREATERYGRDYAGWLAKALDYMNELAPKMKTKQVEYTEVIFRTKGDFGVGFYQQGTSQSAFVRLSSYGDEAVAPIKMPQMRELHDLIEVAIQQLQTLGAK
jgi:hypothetical protein